MLNAHLRDVRRAATDRAEVGVILLDETGSVNLWKGGGKNPTGRWRLDRTGLTEGERRALCPPCQHTAGMNPAACFKD
jgi:hypothetical protein